ncbi:hypothetical protein HID58_043340, partial [Brassica napus]
TSLNLLRGDFGTRRIETINFFKGIYTTGSKPLRAYLQDAICRGLSYGSISGIRLIMTFIWGQNKGSKRGILVEQRGHGATNKDDYKDQARWSSPSIQDFGNLSKSEVYIWTSDHGRRFPHSHEISSYLNESTVIGTDWVTVMEHIRCMNSL